MQIEFKNWKAAEARVDAARAAEREAYEAFRENLNKRAEWSGAKWAVSIAQAAEDAAFKIYLAVDLDAVYA